VRERWLGASGRKVPEIVVEGELALPEETLVLEDVLDTSALQGAFDDGRPIVVRADTAEGVRRALARPEVSCVIIPRDQRALLELDLRTLTYG
jgi:hypothetical protein